MRILGFLTTLTAASGCWPYTRDHVVDCIDRKKELYDLNRDTVLDRTELAHLFQHSVPRMLRGFVESIGGVESTMANCDVDHDGVLSQHDLTHSTETCLAECWKIYGAAQILC